MRKYAPANNFVLTLLLLIVVTAFHAPYHASPPVTAPDTQESCLNCGKDWIHTGLNFQSDFINDNWKELNAE